MYEALTQSIEVLLFSSLVLNFCVAELICIFGPGRAQYISTAAGTAVSWITLFIVVKATAELPEAGIWFAVILGIIVTIIVCLVMPHLSFGGDLINLFINKNNKQEKKLREEGKISQRSLAFYKESEALYARGATWNRVVDELEKQDYKDANIDWWRTQNDMFLIMFYSNGGPQGEWLFNLEYRGINDEGVCGWEATFPNYDTMDDIPSVETMNIMLTLVEKVFLLIDPDAQYDIEKTLVGGIADAVKAKIKGTQRSIEPRPLRERFETRPDETARSSTSAFAYSTKSGTEEFKTIGYCIYCGEAIEEGNNFCTNCGKQVTQVENLMNSDNKPGLESDSHMVSQHSPRQTYKENKPARKNRKLIPIVAIAVLLIGMAAGGLFVWKPWDPYVKSAEIWQYGNSEYSGYHNVTKRSEYDSDGRIIKETVESDEEYQSTEWTYDEGGFVTHLDRLIESHEDSSTFEYDIDWEYKKSGNAKLLTKKTRQTYYDGEPDDFQIEEYQYDDQGVPVKEHYVDGDVEETVSYKKDKDFDTSRKITGYDEEDIVVAKAKLYDNNVVSVIDRYESEAHTMRDEYYEDGKLKKTIGYNAGEPIGEEVYDENEKMLKGEAWNEYFVEYNEDDTLKSIGVESLEYRENESSREKHHGRTTKQEFESEIDKITIYYEWERKSKLAGADKIADAAENADQEKKDDSAESAQENGGIDDEYPIIYDENNMGYEAELSENYTFMLIGDPYDHTIENSYEIVSYKNDQETIEVFDTLETGHELRCVGKYEGLFYFNECANSFSPVAVYTYKIGDSELKKVADGINLDNFRQDPEYGGGGNIAGRYVIAHKYYPTDAIEGFGPLFIFDLNTNKAHSMGYVYDYILVENAVRWEMIDPELLPENRKYKVTVKEFNAATGKTSELGSFNANTPEFNYGGADITESEAMIKYIDEDGNEYTWSQKY